jgi:hypothetical protein
MATGERSQRSGKNAVGRQHESIVAAGRLRPQKRSFVLGIGMSMAWHWPTGRRNCGCSWWANDRPPLRHSWPTFERAAQGWCVGQGG